MNNVFVIERNVESWNEAIRACADILYKNGNVDDGFCQACIEREEEYPTGLPAAIGVAIPHTKSEHVYCSGICVLRSNKPISFRRMDDPDMCVETNFVFNLAIDDPNKQLNTLSKVMEFIQNDKLLHQCKEMPLEELNNTITLLFN